MPTLLTQTIWLSGSPGTVSSVSIWHPMKPCSLSWCLFPNDREGNLSTTQELRLLLPSPGARILSRLEFWKSGILEIWNSGILEIWNSGILEIWNSGRVSLRKSGILEIWNSGRVSLR